MTTEHWNVVRQAPHYEVSNLGKVRRSDTGRNLSLTIRANGYVSVPLVVAGGTKKRFYVHRLVADAFIAKIADGMQVNHMNFIRHDNAWTNLEIVTCAQNAAHSKAAGRLAAIGSNTPIGEASCRSKLKEAEVLRMRQMHASGVLKVDLSRIFGISKSQVCDIVELRSWRRQGLPG